jgi:hypothetical protein
LCNTTNRADNIEAKDAIMRLALFAVMAGLPVFVCDLGAQTLDSQVVFEVASVKHGAPDDYGIRGNGGGPGTKNPTSYSVENYPLSSLLEIAYGISSYRLVGAHVAG